MKFKTIEYYWDKYTAWSTQRLKVKKDRGWHTWFAWRPVILQDRDHWVWLRWIEREYYVFNFEKYNQQILKGYREK